MNQQRPTVSAKGFYYNLEMSPYEWVSPYGDIYKMPSKKRLEMMETKTKEELQRLDKLLQRNRLGETMPERIVELIRKYCIDAVYRQIVE